MHRRELLKGLAIASASTVLSSCAKKLVKATVSQPPCLPRVNVSTDRIIRSICGLRPFRRSGFVVRPEQIGDTLVVTTTDTGAPESRCHGEQQSWLSTSARPDIAVLSRCLAPASWGFPRPACYRIPDSRSPSTRKICLRTQLPTSPADSGIRSPFSRRNFGPLHSTTSSRKRATSHSLAIRQWLVLATVCAGRAVSSLRIRRSWMRVTSAGREL